MAEKTTIDKYKKKQKGVAIFWPYIRAMLAPRNIVKYWPIPANIFKISFNTFLAALSPLKAVITDLLFFDGKNKDLYLTKEVLKDITDRYKETIGDLNRKIGITISFGVLALYVYYVLPDTESVKIPFMDISVSRQIWISIAPAISYGLSILIIVSSVWFVGIRNGMKNIIEKSTVDTKVSFADLSNILLKGTIGDLWMIFKIQMIFESRWNYVWYIPLISLLVLIFLNPMIISLFFTYQLFATGNLFLGILYTILFFPISFLLLLLLGFIAILSGR